MDEEKPLFQGMDELERTYAPQQLPPDDPEQKRVRAEEGADVAEAPGVDEAPEPGPIASIGNTPTASAVPVNVGHEEAGRTPGAPDIQVPDPMGTQDKSEETR